MKVRDEGGRILTRTLLILLLIFVFSIFILLYVLLPHDKFTIVVDSFNKVAVGLSSLAAVIFGPTLISTELEKNRKIKEYGKQFPHNNFGTDWEIIQSEKHMGAIYVLDIKKKIKYHILNMKTVYDLGWHIYPRKTIKDDLFRSYQVGDRIRTQGEAGE